MHHYFKQHVKLQTVTEITVWQVYLLTQSTHDKKLIRVLSTPLGCVYPLTFEDTPVYALPAPL